MIKNIEIPRPFQRNIKFSFGEVEFDSNVLDAVEMDDRVVVQLSNKNNPPEEKTVNIFCYAKPTSGQKIGKLLWKVQPPKNFDGKPLATPYYNLGYLEKFKGLYATSLGFGYKIDSDTGASSIVQTDIK